MGQSRLPKNFGVLLLNVIYLGATDGDVDSNLFVTTDTEGSDGVTGLACSEIG